MCWYLRTVCLLYILRPATTERSLVLDGAGALVYSLA